MVAQVAPPKVLVIDDEDLFRDMLRVVLGEEYEVIQANSTDAGLRLFNQEHPDAVLLDLVMPGRDGMQGLKAIRAVDPDVSVVIVTGYGKLETAKQAMSLGASCYVEKPVKTDELRKTVHRCVEHTQLERRRVQSFEEMTGMIRQLSSDLALKTEQVSHIEAVFDLMYDLTHPLTESMTQMQQLGDIIDRDKADAKDLGRISQSLSLVEWNIQRCRELTEMCRTLNRKHKANQDIFSISDEMHAVIEEMAPWAETAGVKADFRLYPMKVTLFGHRTQFCSAIKHVIGNAIQSAGRGGVVRMACLQDKTHLEIRIEDHGRGHDLEKISREFSGEFDHRDVVKGAGLGLCMASRIIEKHGGYLHVRSAPEKGTVVFIRLPLTA